MRSPLHLCRACGAELAEGAEACSCCGTAVPKAREPRKIRRPLLLLVGLACQAVGLWAIGSGLVRVLARIGAGDSPSPGDVQSELWTFGVGVLLVGVGSFLFLLRRVVGGPAAPPAGTDAP
ncbi:MAG: hypothetical protein HY720_23545 [Planctomycetes bacterium]|nr:hypothetical protein [Planctomycetota bacterium]